LGNLFYPEIRKKKCQGKEEMIMTMKQIIKKEPVTALFLGGLIGGGAAILFAPRSGKETRKRIEEFADDVKGGAQCYYMRGKGKVTTAVGKGRDFFEGKRSLIMASVEAGKDAYAKERVRLAKTH
jgi:gas vesicle protein